MASQSLRQCGSPGAAIAAAPPFETLLANDPEAAHLWKRLGKSLGKEIYPWELTTGIDKLEEATDEAQRQAKRDFETLIERTKARFWESYNNGETSQARDEAESLKKLIDDEDDKDWIRYDVLLEYLIGGKKG